MFTLYALERYGPYGPRHFVEIHGQMLRAELLGSAQSGSNRLEWLRYGSSNAPTRGYMILTNVQWDEKEYRCVYKVESTLFRDLGALYGTTNGEVFLIKPGRKPDLVQPKRH